MAVQTCVILLLVKADMHACMHACTHIASEAPNQKSVPRTTTAICSTAYALFCVEQFSVEDDLVPQMRACATHAFSAVLNKLNPMRRQHCFELFGLDFMVDACHKVPSIVVPFCQLVAMIHDACWMCQACYASVCVIGRHSSLPA